MQGGHHPNCRSNGISIFWQHIREKYRTSPFMDSVRRNFSNFAESSDAPSRSDLGNSGRPASDHSGRGGEILVDRVRKRISPLKITAMNGWR